MGRRVQHDIVRAQRLLQARLPLPPVGASGSRPGLEAGDFCPWTCGLAGPLSCRERGPVSNTGSLGLPGQRVGPPSGTASPHTSSAAAGPPPTASPGRAPGPPSRGPGRRPWPRRGEAGSPGSRAALLACPRTLPDLGQVSCGPQGGSAMPFRSWAGSLEGNQ